MFGGNNSNKGGSSGKTPKGKGAGSSFGGGNHSGANNAFSSQLDPNASTFDPTGLAGAMSAMAGMGAMGGLGAGGLGGGLGGFDPTGAAGTVAMLEAMATMSALGIGEGNCVRCGRVQEIFLFFLLAVLQFKCYKFF